MATTYDMTIYSFLYNLLINCSKEQREACTYTQLCQLQQLPDHTHQYLLAD